MTAIAIAVVRRHLDLELEASRRHRVAGDHGAAWRSLERAHVLSQTMAWPHVRVHLRMLAVAWQRRDWREVVGQLPRIALAAPGSLLGRAPRGNTGGADVGIFTPMAIPADLQAILDGRDDRPAG